VNFRSGIFLCVLAGCASQPTRPAPTPRVVRAEAAVPTPPPFAMRVGVEYLPPRDADDAEAPTATGDRQPRIEDPRRRERDPKADKNDKKKNRRRAAEVPTDYPDEMPVPEAGARLTLAFFDELVDADRHRIRRELGKPLLIERTDDLQSPGLLLSSEIAFAEEQAEWVHEHSTDFLRRPFRRMLRRTALVEALDMELDSFRADHVPLSQPYRDAHTDDRHLGRMSVRVHVNDFNDPLEIAYSKSGVRVGTSQENLKLGVSRPLGEDLSFALHTHYGYETGEWHIRTDLGWHLSPRTSVHLVLGDDLDFLATSTVYSLFDSPMDGSPGLLLYAVHIF
jgi:hypothetical protein